MASNLSPFLKRVNSIVPRQRTTLTVSSGPNEEEVKILEGVPVYVRVSFMVLSGIETTRRKGRKDIEDDDVPVVAFASIIRRGGEVGAPAPSRPLKPGDSIGRHALVWDDAEDTPTVSRRVCFSTILSKDDSDDGNSPDLVDLFAPEIFEIRVGLMKEDEVITLGVATFAVSDQDIRGLRMELPLRTYAKNNGNSLGVGGASKSPLPPRSPSPRKKIGRLRGRFFCQTKQTPPINSFSDDSRLFHVAPNATLRISLDVKPNFGSIEESNPWDWGEYYDSSLATSRSTTENLSSDGPITVYDLPSTPGSRAGTVDPQIAECQNQHDSIEVMKGAEGTTVISSFASVQSEPNNIDDHEDDALSDQTSFVISSVVMSTNEEFQKKRRQIRKLHPMTPSSLLNTMALGFCGNPRDTDDRIETDLSFDSTLPDEHPDYLDDFGERVPAYNNLGTITEGSRPTQRRSSASRSASNPRYYDVSDDSEVVTVTEMSLEQSHDDRVYGRAGHDDETVGDETIDSVNKARNTLRKYASRVGVQVEDLLENETFDDRTRSSAGDETRTYHTSGDTLENGSTVSRSTAGSMTIDSQTMDTNTYDSRTVDDTIGGSTYKTVSTRGTAQ